MSSEFESRIAQLEAKILGKIQSGSAVVPPATAVGDNGAAAPVSDSPKTSAPSEGGPATLRADGAAVGGDDSHVALLEREVVRHDVGSFVMPQALDATLAMLRGANVKVEVTETATELLLPDGRRFRLTAEALNVAGVPAALLRSPGVGGTGSQTSGAVVGGHDLSPLNSQKAWDSLKPSERRAFIKKVFAKG